MKLHKYPLVLCLLLASAGTWAQDKASAIVADGNDWLRSSATERRAFLVGAANMVVAEKAYAKNHGIAASQLSEQFTQGVSSLKLPDIEARLTSWYTDNPAERTRPVMSVLWHNIIKGKR